MWCYKYIFIQGLMKYKGIVKLTHHNPSSLYFSSFQRLNALRRVIPSKSFSRDHGKSMDSYPIKVFFFL